MSAADKTPIIEVEDLCKIYRTGMRRKKVEAVKGISFRVDKGEIFGFVGPNGAGKTTTIRMLMGLIRPTAGRARLFGHTVPSRAARSRLGFLPESPYFYEYLSVGELLDLVGRIFGMSRAARTKRADELIELVGLGRAGKRPIKSYSKGMMQRAGIAQALMSDPELVVLDEPTSGLDPLGRKEVRDIILSLHDAGKTVFFSSHILADVEAIADRVAILVGGQVHDVGTIAELIDQSVQSTEVVLRADGDVAELSELATSLAQSLRTQAGQLIVQLAGDADVDQFLARCHPVGGRVVSVTPRRETLEDLFLRRARLAGSEGLGAQSAGEGSEAVT